MQQLPWNRNSLPSSSFPSPHYNFLAFDSLKFVLCSFHFVPPSRHYFLPLCPSLDFNVGFDLTLLPPQFVHFLVQPLPYHLQNLQPRCNGLLELHSITHRVHWHHHLCALCSLDAVSSTTVFLTSVPGQPTSSLPQSHSSLPRRTRTPLPADFQQTTSSPPAKGTRATRRELCFLALHQKTYFQSPHLASHFRSGPPSVCYGIPLFPCLLEHSFISHPSIFQFLLY